MSDLDAMIVGGQRTSRWCPIGEAQLMMPSNTTGLYLGSTPLQGLAMAEAACLTSYSIICGTSNVFGASQTIWDDWIYVKPGRRYRLPDSGDTVLGDLKCLF
jgi:hypothetical protein